MPQIIEDPSFEDFNGIYAGSKDFSCPTKLYNYTEMIRYMKSKNKEFKDLTKEEIESFRTN